MSRNKKTLIVTICAAIVVILGLVALKFLLKKNISSSQDVLKSYAENIEKCKNMEIKGTINLKLRTEGELKMELPVDISLDVKTDLKNNAYSEISTGISMIGFDYSTSGKSYNTITDDNKIITYTANEGEKGTEWYVNEEKLEHERFNISDLKKQIDENKDMIENIDFLSDKDGYTLTLDLSKVDIEKIMKPLSEYNKSEKLSEIGMNEDVNLEKAEGSVVLKFDKDCYLQSIEAKDITMKMKSDTQDAQDTQAQSGSITLNINIKLSNYNKLDEKDYKVPESIKNKSATATDSTQDNNGNDTENKKTEETKSDEAVIMDEWGNVINGNTEDNIYITEDTSDKTPDYTNNDYSQYWGFYLGNDYITFPSTYKYIKGTGWNVNLEDYGIDENYELEQYARIKPTIELKNNSYNADILVGFENRTEGSLAISNSNIWSMNINNSNGGCPDIRIYNDIKWGSSAEDISSLIGEPASTEEYSDGTKYTYDIDNGEYTLSLRLYINTENGLEEVEIYNE